MFWKIGHWRLNPRHVISVEEQAYTVSGRGVRIVTGTLVDTSNGTASLRETLCLVGEEALAFLWFLDHDGRQGWDGEGGRETSGQAYDIVARYHCAQGQHTWRERMPYSCEACGHHDYAAERAYQEADLAARRAAGTLAPQDDPESPAYLPY